MNAFKAFSYFDKMTRELVWSIQNGDLDEVKSYFDEKVKFFKIFKYINYFFINQIQIQPVNAENRC